MTGLGPDLLRVLTRQGGRVSIRCTLHAARNAPPLNRGFADCLRRPTYHAGLARQGSRIPARAAEDGGFP